MTQNTIDNLKLLRINTTAWEEEDFLLLTTLNEEQITKVIAPIISELRGEDNDDGDYDNDYLISNLAKAYPDAVIHMYQPDNIDTLSF